ncbi:MAG: transposase, partial [Spirochaetes bacterium]
MDLKKDSFIEPKLKEYFSDMLYQIQLDNGQQSYVYLLLEHKSHPFRLTRLQLLRYMVCIWENELKGPKTSTEKESQKRQSSFLPLILPIVFSQSEKGWRY